MSQMSDFNGPKSTEAVSSVLHRLHSRSEWVRSAAKCAGPGFGWSSENANEGLAQSSLEPLAPSANWGAIMSYYFYFPLLYVLIHY
jgi:hypothetical protein